MNRILIILGFTLILLSCKLNEDERISSKIHGIYTITKIEQSGDTFLDFTESDTIGEIAFKYEGNNLARLNPGEVVINPRLEDVIGFFNAMKKKNNFYWVWSDNGYIDAEVSTNAIVPTTFRLEIEMNKPKKKIIVFEGSYRDSQGRTINVKERIFLKLKDI